MSTKHFVVSQRDSVWQFSFRGDVTAPFTSKQAAIDAAIAEAGSLDTDDVEVLVRDADLRTQTIWRAGAGTLSEHEAERLAADTERDADA